MGTTYESVFCKKVEEAIEDERHAVKEYTNLRYLHSNVLVADVIQSIAIDEKKHLDLLMTIQALYCREKK